MSIMRSTSFQSRNGLKEDKRGKLTVFPGQPKYEDVFVAGSVSLKQNVVERSKSLEIVPCIDASGSKGYRRSPSLRILSDEDRDPELEKAIQEDYSFRDLHDSQIIGRSLNTDVDHEIDQLTGEFGNCVVKTIYRETGDLDDGTPAPENGLEIKITMDVVRRSSNSSNQYSHHKAHRRSISVISEPVNTLFSPEKPTLSEEYETPRNDPGLSNLPLPPRLKEASYRNPLGLSSSQRYYSKLEAPSSVGQLFQPKEPSIRHNVQSALSNIVKKPKDLSVSYFSWFNWIQALQLKVK